VNDTIVKGFGSVAISTVQYTIGCGYGMGGFVSGRMNEWARSLCTLKEYFVVDLDRLANSDTEITSSVHS